MAERLYKGVVPVLEKPPISDDLYELIVDLTSSNPQDRPLYTSIMTRLGLAENSLTASNRIMKDQHSLYMKHADLLKMAKGEGGPNVINIKPQKANFVNSNTKSGSNPPPNQYSSVDSVIDNKPKDLTSSYAKSPSTKDHLVPPDPYKKAPSMNNVVNTVDNSGDYSSPNALLDKQ